MPPTQKPVSRQERRRRERRKDLGRQQRVVRRSMSRWAIVGILAALVIAIAAIVGFVFLVPQMTQASAQPGGAIDGISCNEQVLTYHIHAHLTLYRDGQPVLIPADVGIPINPAIQVNNQAYCFYWLHTHATNGVIHVESPTSQTYTLKQFFDIWHFTALWDAQTSLAATAGIHVDGSFVAALSGAKTGTVRAFVGSTQVTDYRAITLSSHELITLEVGPPFKPPNTYYKFAPNE